MSVGLSLCQRMHFLGCLQWETANGEGETGNGCREGSRSRIEDGAGGMRFFAALRMTGGALRMEEIIPTCNRGN